jgi:hypothetical protein
MANITNALKKLYHLEYSNDTSLFLHHNENEDGYTLGGIYEKFNKEEIDWDFARDLILLCDGNIKRASNMIYHDTETQKEVEEIFRKNYWDRLSLDHIESEIIAEEIFIFAVVAGVKNSARLAQAIVGAKTDGIIGSKTIAALNNFNEIEFDGMFDVLEIKYFNELVEKNPTLSKYIKGWRRRAKYT